MDSKAFICEAGEFLDQWLRRIARDLHDGKLKADGPYSFPTVLRTVETPHHFIAELCGAKVPTHPTSVRLRRPKSAERFDSAMHFFNGGFSVAGVKRGVVRVGDCGVHCLTLATPYDHDVFIKKINYPLKSTMVTGEGTDVPLFIPDSITRLHLSHLDIVRTDTFRVRFRTISTAFCVSRQLTNAELSAWLRKLTDDSLKKNHPFGLILDDVADIEQFGRELSSLSSQDVNEAVLDHFIQEHGEHFRTALNYRDHISHAKLKWIERGSSDPGFSIPDFMLQREDGCWDILDLKCALLKQKSIVKGIPARPQFIAYVCDLVAQLVKYQEYFANQANAQWAAAELGVRIDDIRLIGVVGDYDTAKADEVELALKQYKDNITVLSYTDVANLLRSSQRKDP